MGFNWYNQKRPQQAFDRTIEIVYWEKRSLDRNSQMKQDRLRNATGNGGNGDPRIESKPPRWIGLKFWRIVRPYWTSKERWLALTLLAAIIGFVVVQVYISVMLNETSGRFFDALQNRNSTVFYQTISFTIFLLLFQLACQVLQTFCSQLLDARWRRWLTDHYTNRWLTHRAFYELRFRGRADNPDQRIAEDFQLLTAKTINLGVGFINMALTVVTFASVLWNISGTFSFSLGNMQVPIPGYMFWAALLYWLVGMFLGHAVGNPLIRLNHRQQGLEANFRFGLIRVREGAEGIALYGGEAQERSRSRQNLQAVYSNSLKLIYSNAKLQVFQNFIVDTPDILPFLAMAPRFFSGAMQLGDLMRIGNGFSLISHALSWLVNSYGGFAEWHATVDRLIEFSNELDQVNTSVSGFEMEDSADGSIRLEQAIVALPDGNPLIPSFNLRLRSGQSVLIKGISGSGKSTLFRVLAGLWPFGRGCLYRPELQQSLFLPQQPYIPIGTLRDALYFPSQSRLDEDIDLRAVLSKVGLEHLGDRLNDQAHWEQILSPGEQQRLAIAKAILLKPEWLFLDEATSAIDEEQEALVYKAMARLLPDTTIISIGHRQTLEQFHNRVILLEQNQSGIELADVIPGGS
ncbi:MAG: ABC transporter ATP-binding protein/permease [Nostoc sp.]|uniref:ABC transporter ATP-binding protein/permease n=1 Tax=Nostoc sp. TaxID=1180 RepID=UPI002FEEC57E